MTEAEKSLFLNLENAVAEKEEVIRSLNEKVVQLTEQINWFQRQIFGKKSERIVSNQTPHPEFEGFNQLVKTEEQKTQEVPAHKRRISSNKEDESILLDPNLPVKSTILDIPEEEKVCKETGVALVKIGEEVSDKIAHAPGSYYIKRTIRPKYAHPKNPENCIYIAELPEGILKKCQADNSLLAQIITEKFADHLPLNRISEKMDREGVYICRKLLSKWVLCS